MALFRYKKSVSVGSDQAGAHNDHSISDPSNGNPHKRRNCSLRFLGGFVKRRSREKFTPSNSINDGTSRPVKQPTKIAPCPSEHGGNASRVSLDSYVAGDTSSNFVCKSHLFTAKSDGFGFRKSELVDLTGRSLSTIPTSLYENAASIICLSLSRNPLVEIPLDFIQCCIILRELRLCSMGLKKVPQSIRHSASLRCLDLSCNRIADLDDAGFDLMSGLSMLKLQNNRMEQLPWYFSQLRMLQTLNISNNKFNCLPSIICDMPALRDLDVSFNAITHIPEDIGQLTALEQLILVGNQISKLPEQFSQLVSLQVLDCRRNSLSDLSVTHTLPRLEKLIADHNVLRVLDFTHGPHDTAVLDVSFNNITSLKLDPFAQTPFALTSLDVSHAKLSSLDDFAFSHLSALQTLRLDNNSLRTLPDSLGELSYLTTLSCSDNCLDALPETIGSLRRLEILDVHNNSLRQLPVSLWDCSSLVTMNLTSNLLGTWCCSPEELFVTPSVADMSLDVPPTTSGSRSPFPTAREESYAATYVHSRPSPRLVFSLEKLYIGENRIADDSVLLFTALKELRVLNLAFNKIRQLPSSFLRNLTKLEELYLGGNQLISIPTEDLHRLTKLNILFLDANQLRTLPQELSRVHSLTEIDVGCNQLRYNINNWEYDWNWNFNQNLKYLNLSGNKKFEIRFNHSRTYSDQEGGRDLAHFSNLTSLRVLGLMGVITTLLRIPENTEDRRVRSLHSEVNGMSYGIADNLGDTGYLSMFDLVQPEFRGHTYEAVFAMFGQSNASPSSNHLSRYLRNNFLSLFSANLGQIDQSKNETALDALRRTFLRLNNQLHDALYVGDTWKIGAPSFEGPYRAGASGIVLYFVGKTVYAANVGNTLAVVSMQGYAELLSRKHDPLDRLETERIQAAEGWISPEGLVHAEIDVSRSFGYFCHFPVINAQPYVEERQLTERDEFVIVGDRGLWDYMSYQTAVDIARSQMSDPMMAAQRLRDLAISYGSHGCTMVMVIRVADLFKARR